MKFVVRYDRSFIFEEYTTYENTYIDDDDTPIFLNVHCDDGKCWFNRDDLRQLFPSESFFHSDQWVNEEDVIILFFRHGLSCSWLQRVVENIKYTEHTSLKSRRDHGPSYVKTGDIYDDLYGERKRKLCILTTNNT